MKKNYIKLILAIVVLSTICTTSYAQFRYKADFKMLVDNLEGSVPYAPTRTIAGVSLNPMVGFKKGNHSLMAGAHILAEFGTKVDIDKAQLRAYYEYKDTKFHATAGMFSRYITEAYPKTFFTTAAPFINETMSGVYGKYKTEKGFIEAWLDWQKSDRANGVDKFTTAVNAERKWCNAFILNGILMYTHVADLPVLEDYTVLESYMYTLNIGYDFAKHQDVFKVLRCTFGLLGNAERKRDEADLGMDFNNNFVTQQTIVWKGFTLDNVLRTGNAMYTNYKEYPSAYTGSPFNQADFVNTLTAKYTYKFKWLTAYAAFATYFMHGQTATQQIVGVNFSLDDTVNFKKK